MKIIPEITLDLAFPSDTIVVKDRSVCSGVKGLHAFFSIRDEYDGFVERVSVAHFEIYIGILGCDLRDNDSGLLRFVS